MLIFSLFLLHICLIISIAFLRQQRVADLCLADFDWVAHKLRKKMPIGEENTKKTLSKGIVDMLNRFDEELEDCILLEVCLYCFVDE